MQLWELDRCRPAGGPFDLPSVLSHIESPLNACISSWQESLASHPDNKFAHYILQGLQEGFRIGYQYSGNALRQMKRNMPIPDPGTVSEYVGKELREGRILEFSLEEASALSIQCSPLGMIPKKNKPGKWRLIVDLSSPTGASVNDGIAKELCSFQYTSVDVIAGHILRMGRGTLMAKMDIMHAYRNVPVHPEDRLLLGMMWDGKVYVDKTLPFGLRSAPLIFTAVADALMWMMQQKGVTTVDHYLDDFITLGKPNSAECLANFRIMLETCRVAGFPVEPDKSEGPSSRMTFLGIEIDSDSMEMRLPLDKLQRLREVLREWRGKKGCKKRDLLSIIGSLSHACKVIKLGRPFLRRLIELSKRENKLDHFVRLNAEARSDIEWWFRFANTWNGVSLMYQVSSVKCSIEMKSDASGSWGCGAFCGRKWFQLKWPSSLIDHNITVKELTPIVLAAAVWGEDWSAKNVKVWCDNSSVVDIINKGESKELDALHLMRCLSFFKAKFQFSLFAEHIAGEDNDLADALSRNNSCYFRSNYSQADLLPTPLPPQLLDLTIILKPDWTSQLWTDLWSAIFRRV